MVRTQIYLTESERSALARMGDVTGKKLAELIREAIDCYLAQSGAQHRHIVLERVAGLWKDRTDLPVPGELRREWHREEAPSAFTPSAAGLPCR
jgi:hypothetical protein